MQRGTILQYSQEDGSGRIVSNGAQFSFVIEQWKGNTAPALNRTVDVDVQGDKLISITEVPESVMLQEKGGEAADALKKFGRQCVKFWHTLVAAAGLVTVIAQIVYVLALFELPAASFQLLWFQGSVSLHELLSSPLLDMPGLYMLCLYASCIAILLPVFIKNRKSWLALFLPLLLLLIVVYEVQSKLREMTSENDLLGNLVFEGIRQMVHVEVGFYLIAASAVVLAVQGLHKFVVAGKSAAPIQSSLSGKALV